MKQFTAQLRQLFAHQLDDVPCHLLDGGEGE
jgi:hypothetical protein